MEAHLGNSVAKIRNIVRFGHDCPTARGCKKAEDWCSRAAGVGAIKAGEFAECQYGTEAKII